ncbi:MAG: efflux transporter outer membrane subunit [Burkholderiaceae bacterium]|nr:efflux transporter outer membrane subunit [Burkholderiaceae bacterium]
MLFRPLPRRPARRGPLHRSCTWAVWLALAGCAPPLPTLAPSAWPVPDTYADAPAQASAPAPDWHAHFTDPALRGLLEQALEHNRDLRAAMLRVEEARLAYGLQRGERLPTVAANLAATRAAVPGVLNATGRRVVGTLFQPGLGFAHWEIDFWGRIGSLSEAALQTTLASEAAQRAVRLGLITQVAHSYLLLREADERLALAQASLDSRAESLRIFRRRTALGATSRLELTQVELLWQQASSLVAQLQQVRATQQQALAVLVGAPIDWPPRQAPQQPLDSLVLAPPLAAGLPSELLVRRPDIVAAEHGLQAAQAQIAAARAAFFPRIALTASAGAASTALDNLFQAGNQAWSFAPTLSLPLWDGGQRQAGLDLAVVRREQAVVRYEQSIQAAFRDVSDALSAQRWLDEQVRHLRATLALQNERARLARLRYEHGATRYLEVLDAERDRLSAEQQLVQTRRAQLSAQVALYAALGGGADNAQDPARPALAEPSTGNPTP